MRIFLKIILIFAFLASGMVLGFRNLIARYKRDHAQSTKEYEYWDREYLKRVVTCYVSFVAIVILLYMVEQVLKE